MRVVITGVDDEGRSCMVAEATPSAHAFEAGGITIAAVARTESSPPPARPPGRAEHIGATPPGLCMWSFVEFPPRTTTAFHNTDSVDFDVVLEGSVDIVLDDGPHRLDRGDGVVINGVDHRWETHDEGCRMSVVVIGTPPLS